VLLALLLKLAGALFFLLLSLALRCRTLCVRCTFRRPAGRRSSARAAAYATRCCRAWPASCPPSSSGKTKDKDNNKAIQKTIIFSFAETLVLIFLFLCIIFPTPGASLIALFATPVVCVVLPFTTMNMTCSSTWECSLIAEQRFVFLYSLVFYLILLFLSDVSLQKLSPSHPVSVSRSRA
jgi:hypothetical protein